MKQHQIISAWAARIGRKGGKASGRAKRLAARDRARREYRASVKRASAG